MVVLGNISHPDVVGDEYKIKTLTSEGSPLSVTTDASGGVWLIVGTDSGFEGLTALYYSRISYTLEAEQTPSVATVTGTVTYRERIALSPNAVVEVTLLDVSRTGASAATIGEQIIENPGQVPVAFEIEYDPADIDDGLTYAVQARITENGEPAFISDTVHSVITGGSPTHVDMVLVRDRGTPTEPVTPPAVGGMAPSNRLLAAIAVVGVLLLVFGMRTLTASRPHR
jgi:putative lipoprotein